MNGHIMTQRAFAILRAVFIAAPQASRSSLIRAQGLVASKNLFP